MLKAAKFSKGAKALKEIDGLGAFGDDVVRNADDGARLANGSNVAQAIKLSAKAALKIRAIYNLSVAEHDKEKSLYASRAPRLHPEDRAFMDERLAENDDLFRRLGTALQNPSSLTEEDGTQIESYLTEFQTDSLEIQAILARL